MDPCEVANHLDEFRNRTYSMAVAYLIDALPLWFFFDLLIDVGLF